MYLMSASGPVSGFLSCSMCEVGVKEEATEVRGLSSERGSGPFWKAKRGLEIRTYPAVHNLEQAD